MNRLRRILLPTLFVIVVTAGLVSPVLAIDGLAKIIVEPQVINVNPCRTFTIDIWIRSLPEPMVEFAFILQWDPTQIEYISRETHVVDAGRGWNILRDEIMSGNRYALQAWGNPFREDASWVTLTFHCLGAGSSQISFESLGILKVRDPKTEIPSEPLDGTVHQIEPRPVGGYVVPANKLPILAPYIALAIMVGAVTAIVAVRKKRRD